MQKRSSQPEWIDLGPGFYTPQEYENCLYQLDRVGRFLGGDRASYWAFKQLPQKPLSILDVGCGGGFFTRRLAMRYPQAEVVGIDLSSEAVRVAKQLPPLANLSFALAETPELDYPPQSFDIVTSTLVCHHLTDQELVSFLKKAVQVAKQGVILNDLQRSWWAFAGFAILAPLLFPNRLIWHDGLLSIKKAFKRKEWLAYLQGAGIPLESCRLTWHWAFRWILYINTINQKITG